jgi:hypothetical protein
MKEVRNIPASVRGRLFNWSKESGENFERTLVRYGVERFLYRLSQHAQRDRFILKGAMLFITWPEGIHRPTGDLDLLGHGPPDPDTMKALVNEICAIADEQDGLSFDAGSTVIEPIREEDKYQGVRVVTQAKLENAVIRLQIDVGFGDRVFPAPKRISFPCLLSGMSVPDILAYPAETVIAEKFEAMVKLGEADSRLKDFSDIWAISRTFPFEMPALVQAMLGTLNQRGTPVPTDIPVALTDAFAALPDKQKGWEGFLRRNPPAVDPPPLPELLADLRGFLGPVIRAMALPEGAKGSWAPGSGWRQ